MSDIWIKATILVLVFAAVVFAVERLLAGYIGRRIEAKAINQRLELIGRGVSRSQAMQMLRSRH